jgi:(p)ppGpp synthase/HD superfamily hydrolase
MVHEQGAPEQVVAAALLHDVVEDTKVTLDQIEDEFGSEVAKLVDLMTAGETIDDYRERKATKRDRILHATDAPAAAIYAADKLANLRALRAAYRNQGEALGMRFNAPLDVKVDQVRADLEMLEEARAEVPFVQELAEELRRFEADRARSRA